ncbi:MerR family transcriptional regulator [Streptomyces himalayensis]|uniref:MerR family transcriptional regulator n=1 Tax=Streptomyces himalayensis subsp. himalayensis TaxID=2756131 RepID=A0A7W0DQD0_9ACTN|nr:MerR family transcriptional regulator [Streptomyces himalayensis]MBA2949331.1 MerR family transcriptional regulator [Streptomyces himalayensis subsp. himalayensis]
MPTDTAEPALTEPTLTVDELAARAGVTVRTIRFYGSKGLLPPPVIGPRRVGHYGPEHLSRLGLIEELQRQGMTLSAIERYLEQLPAGLSAHELAIHRAVVATWAPGPPDRATRAELERRAGRRLSDEDIDRLAAMGVIARSGSGPRDDSGPAAYAQSGSNGAGEESGAADASAAADAAAAAEAPGTDDVGEAPDADTAQDVGVFRLDPSLLRLGVQLLDVPIADETILAARTVLLEHARAVAHELTQLFRDEVWDADRERQSDPDHVAAMKSLSADMQPIVVQALVTAFQRSLREELRDAFQA